MSRKRGTFLSSCFHSHTCRIFPSHYGYFESSPGSDFNNSVLVLALKALLLSNVCFFPFEHKRMQLKPTQMGEKKRLSSFLPFLLHLLFCLYSKHSRCIEVLQEIKKTVESAAFVATEEKSQSDKNSLQMKQIYLQLIKLFPQAPASLHIFFSADIWIE